MKKYYVLLIILLNSMLCSAQKHGFAFYPVDMANFNLVQKKFFTPTNFQTYKSPILFSDKQSIWFSYNPEKRSFKNPYAISLSKKSLGWIEIDLRNKVLNKQTKLIIDKYSNLDPGKYLIRIALNNVTLDQVEFEILNITNQNSDYIDYEAPIETALEQNDDDIKMYSVQ